MANNINDIIYPDLGGFDSTTVKYSFSLSDSGWNGQDAVNGDYYFDYDYKAALQSCYRGNRI